MQKHTLKLHIKLWKHIQVRLKVLGWCLPQQQHIRFGRAPAWRHIVSARAWKSRGLVLCSLLYAASKYIWFNMDQHKSVVSHSKRTIKYSDVWDKKSAKYCVRGQFCTLAMFVVFFGLRWLMGFPHLGLIVSQFFLLLILQEESGNPLSWLSQF